MPGKEYPDTETDQQFQIHAQDEDWFEPPELFRDVSPADSLQEEYLLLGTAIKHAGAAIDRDNRLLSNRHFNPALRQAVKQVIEAGEKFRTVRKLPLAIINCIPETDNPTLPVFLIGASFLVDAALNDRLQKGKNAGSGNSFDQQTALFKVRYNAGPVHIPFGGSTLHRIMTDNQMKPNEYLEFFMESWKSFTDFLNQRYEKSDYTSTQRVVASPLHQNQFPSIARLDSIWASLDRYPVK